MYNSKNSKISQKFSTNHSNGTAKQWVYESI